MIRVPPSGGAAPAHSPGPTTRQDTIWVAGPGEWAGAASLWRMPEAHPTKS